MTRWDRRVALAERRRAVDREFSPLPVADLPELHPDDAAMLELVAANARTRPDTTTTVVVRRAERPHDLVPVTIRTRAGQVEIEAGSRLEPAHPITGLPGERAVADYLHRALAECGPGSGVLVIVIGVDHFRGYHRRRGGPAGAELLRWVGRALATRLTPGDLLAHTGGDLFTVVAPKIHARHEAFVLAESLRACLLGETDPLVKGVTLSAGCAIGGRTTDGAELVLDAHDALFAAKAAGRNQTKSMDSPLRETVLTAASVDDRLLSALEEDRVALHFQPVFDIGVNRIVSMEGLLCIDEAGGEATNPAELLHLATDSTLLQRLEARLFKLLCQQVAAWEPIDEALQLSLNVNVRFARHREVWERMLAYIGRAGLRPGSFSIEIDGQLIASDTDNATQLVRCFREAGIDTCVDNFTGEPAAFSVLEQVRPDRVKLDRSVVASVTSDVGAAAAAACVETLDELGITVTAVGVESAPQLDRLRSMGCRLVQGWLLSPPLSPKMAERLLIESGGFAPAAGRVSG